MHCITLSLPRNSGVVRLELSSPRRWVHLTDFDLMFQRALLSAVVRKSAVDLDLLLCCSSLKHKCTSDYFPNSSLESDVCISVSYPILCLSLTPPSASSPPPRFLPRLLFVFCF